MPPTPFIHHSPCGLRNKHNPNDQRNPYTKVRDAGSFFLDAKQPDYMYDGGSPTAIQLTMMETLASGVSEYILRTWRGEKKTLRRGATNF
jgi:hypothetical protein